MGHWAAMQVQSSDFGLWYDLKLTTGLAEKLNRIENWPLQFNYAAALRGTETYLLLLGEEPERCLEGPTMELFPEFPPEWLVTPDSWPPTAPVGSWLDVGARCWVARGCGGPIFDCCCWYIGRSLCWALASFPRFFFCALSVNRSRGRSFRSRL